MLQAAEMVTFVGKMVSELRLLFAELTQLCWTQDIVNLDNVSSS